MFYLFSKFQTNISCISDNDFVEFTIVCRFVVISDFHIPIVFDLSLVWFNNKLDEARYFIIWITEENNKLNGTVSFLDHFAVPVYNILIAISIGKTLSLFMYFLAILSPIYLLSKEFKSVFQNESKLAKANLISKINFKSMHAYRKFARCAISINKVYGAEFLCTIMYSFLYRANFYHIYLKILTLALELFMWKTLVLF